MRPPFRFHCFKCETSGVLNQQVLRDLGVYNNDLTIDLAEANKFVKGNGVQKISTKSLKIMWDLSELMNPMAFLKSKPFA